MNVFLFVIFGMLFTFLPIASGELDNFQVYSECDASTWTAYITDSNENPLDDITAIVGSSVSHLNNGVITIPSSQNIGTVIIEKEGYTTQTLNTDCFISDIPSWIKNIIIFWSSNQITDAEFKNSLTYLIDQGIIKTETKKQYHELLIENIRLEDQIKSLEEDKQCLVDLNIRGIQINSLDTINEQCNDLEFPTPPPVTINAEPLDVIFINLEKAGESILVISPDDSTMLIDGGLKGSFGNLTSVLDRHNVDRIDVMISTHADQDHISGLINILESSIDVGEVWISPLEGTTKTYKSFLSAVNNNGLTTKVAVAGQDIELDPSVDVSVLGPPAGGVPGAKDDKNENSVIIHLEYGDLSFLFTGDAEEKAEEFLIRNPIDINIINGPHHGSKGSSTSEFIRAFDPEVVIFSADEDNRYGHPHDEVISRYYAYDRSIELYQTGIDGTIHVETDGVHCTLMVDYSSPKPCYPGVEILP